MNLEQYSSERCGDCGQGLNWIEIAFGRVSDPICGKCLKKRKEDETISQWRASILLTNPNLNRRGQAAQPRSETMKLSRRSKQGLRCSPMCNTVYTDGSFDYQLYPESEDQDVRKASEACIKNGLPLVGRVDSTGKVTG